MNGSSRLLRYLVIAIVIVGVYLVWSVRSRHANQVVPKTAVAALPPDEDTWIARRQAEGYPPLSPPITTPAGSGVVEQTAQGLKPAPVVAASFDGLGAGFRGPQGVFHTPSPADNSLAVGPDHIVQTVNEQMAIYTKKGKRFDTTGKVLYGPVNTNNVFKGFGGTCERHNGGDAVVRYDQLADRWLIVMGGQHEDTPPAKVEEWKGRAQAI